jgi:hypothetical protein
MRADSAAGEARGSSLAQAAVSAMATALASGFSEVRGARTWDVTARRNRIVPPLR